MVLETKRLILRNWRDLDAKDLYIEAKDPRIGPIAGWPPHTSVENSLDIIRNVLNKKYTFALELKSENRAVGSIGLMLKEDSNLDIGENEAEIGYWIGVPYWGEGLVPEAIDEIIRFSFEELNLNKIWCGYFEGNLKSKRAQEKCGFKYHHTNNNVYWSLMDDIRTEHVSVLEKDIWLKN
ncbi:MAG: GNAT family N-acetyltransferase [Pleomorphochaeta sp.]